MKIKLILLLLVPILLLNLGYGLDLEIVEPHQNHTFTYSYNLPLEVDVTGHNNTCWFSINACYQSGPPVETVCDDTHRGTNIPFCEDFSLSVDYDGNYTLDVFASNGTDTINKTNIFYVYRTTEFEEGKPYLAALIIIVFLGISFLFVYVGKTFTEEGFPVLKLVLSFGGIISALTTISLSVVTIEEYLKFPSMANIVGVYLRSLTGVVVFVMFFLTIMFMFKLIMKWKETEQKKKW